MKNKRFDAKEFTLMVLFLTFVILMGHCAAQETFPEGAFDSPCGGNEPEKLFEFRMAGSDHFTEGLLVKWKGACDDCLYLKTTDSVWVKVPMMNACDISIDPEFGFATVSDGEQKRYLNYRTGQVCNIPHLACLTSTKVKLE